MMKLTLFAFALLVFQFVQAQSFFGNEFEKGKTGPVKISNSFLWHFGGTANKLVAVGAKGPKVIVTEYKGNLDFIDNYTLKLSYDRNRLNLEDLFEFQGELMFLTSYYNESKKLRYYFIQSYAGHGKLSRPRPIASSEWLRRTKTTLDYDKYEAKLAKDPSIQILISDDKKSFSILIPKKKQNETDTPNEWNVYGFNEKMEMKTQTVIAPKSGVVISEMVLSNDGKLAAIGVENVSRMNDAFYLTAKRSKLFSPQFLGEKYYTIILDLESGEVNEKELDVNGLDLLSYKAKYLNGNLVFCGFYSEFSPKASMNVPKGYFYYKMDDSGKVLSQKRTDFNGFMDPLKEKDDEIKPEKKEKQFVRNYPKDIVVRDVFLKTNGDVVILAEEFDFWETQELVGGGTLVTFYHFQYGDIFAVSCDSDGNSKWMQRIFKEQLTIDDFGFYSSFAVTEKNNSLHFLMNDCLFYANLEKYENQNFSERSKAKETTVLGGATISNSGQLERYVVIENENCSGYKIVTRKAVTAANELVLFGRISSNQAQFRGGVLSLEMQGDQ